MHSLARIGPRLDRGSGVAYYANVLGTKSVLDAMRTAVWRKILFSSTAATYGFHSEMPLREDSPQLPETPHGTISWQRNG